MSMLCSLVGAAAPKLLKTINKCRFIAWVTAMLNVQNIIYQNGIK